MPRSRFGDCDNVLILRNWRSKSWRHLGGLTVEETIEFEALDALPPFDSKGEVAWVFEGPPTSDREERWLELYGKLRK